MQSPLFHVLATNADKAHMLVINAMNVHQTIGALTNNAYALFAFESIVCADAHFVDQTDGVEDVQSDKNTQAVPDLLDSHQLEEYDHFVIFFICTAMFLVEV